MLSKKEMATEASRIIRNQAPKRVSSDIEDQNSKKKNKTVKCSVSMASKSNLGVFASPACRAAQSSDQRFCKRCSCCICLQFDHNKDPSLWLECTPAEGSSGFACHIECVLKHKVGDNKSLQLHLDGSYRCASCGKFSSLIEFMTKQLKIAKDAKRADVFYYRVLLCYRLLDGTSKFEELQKIIKKLKCELEMMRVPLNVAAAKTACVPATGIIGTRHVQDLCKRAIEEAEEIMASNRTSIPNMSDKGKAPMEIDLNNAPDTNEEACPYDATNKSQFIDDKGSGSSGDDFGSAMKTICELERAGHLNKEFRLKFLTWFGRWSSKRERRTLYAFVEALNDDPSRLAEQIIYTFTNDISNC